MQVEPKKTFQENKDRTRWLQDVVDSSNWQIATSLALAEYGMRTPTQDEMRGAVAFLACLTNLAEEPKARSDRGFNLATERKTP